jgi:hypothetical protein
MAYSLNGTTGQDLTSSLTSAFEFGTNDFSITFSCIFKNTSTIQSILCAGEGVNASPTATCQWSIFVANASNELGFLRRTATTTEFYNQFSWSYALDTLYRVCLSRSGENLKLHADGAQVGSSITNTANISAVTNTSFRIGSIYTGAAPVGLKYSNIEISEVAIWKAGLANAEILSLARGFTADQIRPQSLSFYAPLVRNFQDVRGGLAITNNNGATVATHPRIYT